MFSATSNPTTVLRSAISRVGVDVTGENNSDSVMRKARLDWRVEKKPVFFQHGEQQIEVPGQFLTVRSDRADRPAGVLGSVSGLYTPFQNADAFRFMDRVVGDGGASYETAGELKGGKQVWLLARMPGEIRVGNGGEDRTFPYVLLTNRHDGNGAVHIFPTTVRVWCANTLNLAIRLRRNSTKRSAKGLSMGHFPSIEKQVEKAREALGLVAERHAEYASEVEALANRQLTAAEVSNYFKSIFPTVAKPSGDAVAIDGAAVLSDILDGEQAREEVGRELLDAHFAETERIANKNSRILDQILANFENERNTAAGIAGTAWAAYNAVSEYADHSATVHGKTDAVRNDNRLNSIWFGQADKLKQEAFSAALELAR